MNLQDSYRKKEKKLSGDTFYRMLIFFHSLLLVMFISSTVNGQEIKAHKLSNKEAVRRMQADSIYLNRTKKFEKNVDFEQAGGDVEVKLTALVDLQVHCGDASNYAVIETLKPGDIFVVINITPDKWLEVWFTRELNGAKVAYRGFISPAHEP